MFKTVCWTEFPQDRTADNCLQLNTDKTEVLISAPGGVVPQAMDSLALYPPLLNLLSVISGFPWALSLDQHVN